MLFAKKHKSHERFYLLPGQGGRSYRQKQRRLILWAIAVALAFGTVLGAIMWWVSGSRFH